MSWREAALACFAVAPLLIVAMMSPVLRGPAFHHYADARWLLGLPHAGDVLSNLPFVWVGIAGLIAARRAVGLPRGLVALFFAGILGIGLGSGAYHVHPTDATLVFDWLPIVIAVAFLVALVASDRVDRSLGRIAAVVLPTAGLVSVMWWWAGGGTDGGDMRFYATLQLLFIAMVPVMVLLYPKGRLPRADLLCGMVCFVLARLVNTRDASILDSTTLVSGHTVKHLMAGLAAWFVLRAVRRSATTPAVAQPAVPQPAT